MAMKLLSRLKRGSRGDDEWEAQPKCPLLQLPGELRNRIYHLVLLGEKEQEKPIELCQLKRPTLSAACRQLRFECLSYYFRYGSFTYTITLDNDLHLCKEVSKHTLKWIKASKVNKFILHSVTFQFLCLDIDALFDKSEDKRAPLQLMELFRLEGGAVIPLLEESEEDEQHKLSKRNEAKAEKAKAEIDVLAGQGICLQDAARISTLIAQAGRLKLLAYACRSLKGVFKIFDVIDRAHQRLRG